MDNQQDIEFILGVVGSKPSQKLAAQISELSANGAGEQPTDIIFSPFVPEDAQRSDLLFENFSQLADEMRENGKTHDQVMKAIIKFATEKAVETGERKHIQLAVQLFMTHDASGRTIRIPSLMRRMYVESNGELGIGVVGAPNLGGITTSSDEDKLNWFREDPLANEHHEHWHLVYRTQRRFLKERHGELFIYMHQQMLARYDCERLAAGLSRVIPFTSYSENIPVGYDAGRLVVNGTSYKPRPANTKWQNLPQYGISVDQFTDEQNLLSLHISQKSFIGRTGQAFSLDENEGSDRIGDVLEPTSRTVDDQRYGWHHGAGHMFTGLLNSLNPSEAGVMVNTATAIRDPFFWRWHKNIDLFNSEYQDELNPHNFNDSPESISFKEISTEALGLETTNGNVDTLFTELREGVFKFSINDIAYNYNHLWHEEFRYVFKIANNGANSKRVTFRVFLCPRTQGLPLEADPQINDRSLWIEMDKFAMTLEPNMETQVERNDVDSSVIRRPAADPTDVTDILPEPGHPDDFNCECGWPYHLLIPRGTEAGSTFALFVMATDWNLDNVAEPGQCGSMSFCGAGDDYPDSRPMGYPFDRPLSNDLVALVASQDNMALRDIVIQNRASTEVG